MLRGRISILTIVWLMLCLTLAGSWIPSFLVHDNLRFAFKPPDVHRQARISVQTSRGRIIFGRYSMTADGIAAREDFVPGWNLHREPVPSSDDAVYAWRPWGKAYYPGFGHFHWDVTMNNAPAGNPQRYRGDAVMLPPWFVAAMLAMPLPFRAIQRVRRRARAAKHRCPACGYDLRATPAPDGPVLERCPECGEASVNC